MGKTPGAGTPESSPQSQSTDKRTGLVACWSVVRDGINVGCSDSTRDGETTHAHASLRLCGWQHRTHTHIELARSPPWHHTTPPDGLESLVTVTGSLSLTAPPCAPGHRRREDRRTSGAHGLRNGPSQCEHGLRNGPSHTYRPAARSAVSQRQQRFRGHTLAPRIPNMQPSY